MRKRSIPGRRWRVGGAWIVLAALLGVAGSGLAAQTPSPPQRPVAEDPPAEGQQFGNWVITCPGEPAKANCILMQQLTEELSRNVVFVWLMQYDNAGTLTSVFRTPSGVFIKPGLEIKIDSAQQNLKVDFERCDPSQCQAVFSIPGDLLKQFAAAKTLSVAVSLTSGQTVDVPLRMDGFDGAVAALAAKSRHE